ASGPEAAALQHGDSPIGAAAPPGIASATHYVCNPVRETFPPTTLAPSRRAARAPGIGQLCSAILPAQPVGATPATLDRAVHVTERNICLANPPATIGRPHCPATCLTRPTARPMIVEAAAPAGHPRPDARFPRSRAESPFEKPGCDHVHGLASRSIANPLLR